MIYYNCMKEAWVSGTDLEFEVSMTPEGGCSDEEFETEAEFWDWYQTPNL